MSEFYNAEYLSERLAAVCQERDALKSENRELRQICEKQAAMNGRTAAMALELDQVKAERDSLLRLYKKSDQELAAMTKRHEMACEERDVVTLRMIQLEQELAKVRTAAPMEDQEWKGRVMQTFMRGADE